MHYRGTKYPSFCKFDPADDTDPGGGNYVNWIGKIFPEVPDETTCPSRAGWSSQGEIEGLDAIGCADGNGNTKPDCGSAITTGPGYTENGSAGSGVWVRTAVDLSEYRGRRIQVRWVFSSFSFGDDPSARSYSETPFNPGAYYLGAFDDGWHIDDVTFSGLVETQIPLIPDGGDDVVAGLEILCGANLAAETLAAGDDVQALPVGAGCADPGNVVITAGPDGLLDSVAADLCPASPAGFCTGATARIQGEDDGVFLVPPYPGFPLWLDGRASMLDRCSSGTPLYEYVACDTTSSGAPCDAPGSGSLVAGFSPDGRVAVTPPVTTRYRLRVRCSSQTEGAGCEDTAEAVVLVYPPPSQAGEISMTVDCDAASSGDPEVCDAGDAATFAFAKPSQSGTYDGFSLHRFDRSQLASPVISGAMCLVPAFGAGLATGSPVAAAEPAPFLPAPRQVAYYAVAHRPGAPGLPLPADHALPDAGGPPVPRFVSPACP